MKTEQILLALAIAREKSISKAAAALFISQPTASNMLKALESELGYRLFDRGNSGVIPTNEGTAFIEQAGIIERSLDAISQIQYKVEQIDFSILSYCLDFTALAFETLCEQYSSDNYSSNLSYRIVNNTETAARLLVGGKGDLAIVMCLKGLFEAYKRNMERYVFDTVHLCEYPLELTCNKTHPLIQNGSINYDLIEKYPGFSSIQRSTMEPYASFYLPQIIKNSRTSFILDSGPVRHRLLQKTNGYLISIPLPEELKEEYGFQSLPIEDAEVTVFAIYQKEVKDKRMINEYLQYCKALI